MRYYGKILGAIVGWVLLRHPLGAVLGALLGHGFDAGWFFAPKPPPDDAAAPDNAHQVLGVAPDASDADIDRAYRQLMGKYHPDKVAGAADEIRALAEERARAINAAYDRIRQLRRLKR